MSKFKGVKTDNAPIAAKKELRRFALESIEEPSVLEVFCGSGQMYNDVWNLSKNYTGIDKRKFFDRRHTMCGDADKLIRRVDLDAYNIFDIDAYGSPYSILKYICEHRSSKESLCFCITDGINMDLKMGRVCSDVRFFTGIEPHIVKRAHIVHDELIKIIIRKCADILNKNVIWVKLATGKTGAIMKYYSFMLSDAV